MRTAIRTSTGGESLSERRDGVTVQHRGSGPAASSGAGVDPDEPCPFRLARFTRIAIALLLATSIAEATARATLAVGSDPARPDIVDFHPFFLAGRLALDGHFSDSYRVPLMRALEKAFGGGRDVWMPFVYPPSFGLIMAPLAALPVGVAFLLFTAATAAFYLAVLRQLAGDWFWPAALSLSPVLLLDIYGGQNGPLTGGLAGLSAALILRRRSGLAGLAAGALAFKPQMATMLPVLFLLRRDGRALAVAAVSALAFSVIAVLVLGTDTIAGFLSSTSVVADFMAAGSFPLHRMVSVYASALSLGVPPRLALLLQGGTALAAVGAATMAGRRMSRDRSDGPVDHRAAAGLALMATAFVSPYLFDYDLTIYGVGLALVLPALARRMAPHSLAVLLVAVACVGASGFLGQLANVWFGVSISPGAPLLLACSAVALSTLRKREADKTTSCFRPAAVV